MDEQTKAAFTSAADTSKQLITLATGFLALGITFAKDLIHRVDTCGVWLIGGSWSLFLLSIFFGIWTHLALTGSLAKATPTPITIYDKNVSLPAIAQVILFLLGLLLSVVLGIRQVWDMTNA